MPAPVHELLAGGFEAFPVLLPEPVQDVLAVQVALRFDSLPVQDLLDDLHGRRSEAAGPVSEPAPGPEPVDVPVLRRDMLRQRRVLTLPALQPRVLADDVVPVEHRHPRRGQPDPQ